MQAVSISEVHARLGSIILEADRSLTSIRRRERLAGRLLRSHERL